ncbi:hypothetical protein OF83DRAFT_1122799 [Amylostereum chailletii]|nr:hypothetical protein OF83DRAFT_1122799 [Amylostereum chailletii]
MPCRSCGYTYISSWSQESEHAPIETPSPPTESDVHMSDEESYQSDTSASSSSSGATSSSPPPLNSKPGTITPTNVTTSSAQQTTPEPCELLKFSLGMYDPDGSDDLPHFSTTCGAYLELIFTHREAFNACPRSHEGCPAGFSALARALELRAWRADRDADTEAVAAFRHEAWMVAAWMTSGSGGMWWSGK